MNNHRALSAAFATPCLLIAAMQGALGETATTADATAPRSYPETVLVIGTQPSRENELVEIGLTPGGADFVDLAELRDRNVSSLADALRYAPGVWAVSDTGNDDIFFSSRGSNLDATDYDMNGLKLMQDGLPVTTADGNNHNRMIDPLAASYATVARGANALKYGASTLGGAINFVSPTGRDVAGTDLSVRTGSHGQLLTRATFGAAGRTLDGLVTLENKEWQGYRDHNAQDRRGFYGNAGWQVSDGIATRFYATYVENDQELPGALTRAQVDADPDQASRSAETGDFKLDVDTWRLANNTVFQLGDDKRLDVGLSIEEQSLYHPIVDVRVGPNEIQVFSLLVDTDQRDVGAMLKYNQTLDRHDLLIGLNYGENEVAGGDYRNLHGRPNGLMTRIENEAASLEAFAMDRWRIGDRLTLILAAQAVTADRDVRSTDAASGVASNPRADYSHVNPQVGALVRVGDDATFYANVSGLFEPPTNFELEDNVAAGNATLEPMQGSVLEVGTRGRRDFTADGAWDWSISLYYARIRDEILSVENPNAPGTSLVTNIDDTVHAGVEAALGSHFAVGAARSGSLEPRLSLTVNEFRFADDRSYGSNDLPAAPDYVVRAEVVYRAANGFYVGPTLDFVGGRYADFMNAYRIDSYDLVGLRAGWSSNRWRWFVEARNLGDEEYTVSHSVRNVASADAPILNPGEPRSAYVGFEVRFE